MNKVIRVLFNPMTTCLIGLAIGFFFCWHLMVRPLQANLEAREKSLQEWERINRMERETIATIKAMNIDELRKWNATLDEQNTRFAHLQRVLHQQELAMTTGPSLSYIIIALIAVLGVVGFVAWMVRDGNADAARTLNDAVAVLPHLRNAMYATIARESSAGPFPQIVLAENQPATLPSSHRVAGKVVEFNEKEGFGYLVPHAGGNKVFFLRSNITRPSKSESVRIGQKASFLYGPVDGKGMYCAKDVELVE
jgi:cold shock CspA family protein